MMAGEAAIRKLCHDLSQPLTAARGSLELALQLDADDPARAEFFADTLAALERMTAALQAAAEQAQP